jgi:N-methylhydantoinase A/oxoprolinase/acetone carboxylase beta subunit
MIGYDTGQTTVKQLVEKLPTMEPIFITGGHNFYGVENEPLDEKAIEKAAKALDQKVSAWAVSVFFSIKNPDHELTDCRIIQRLSKKPVTLGRDLTGEYDAIRRAATAALNAGLVGIINRMLDGVKKAAKESGLFAKLMVIKGDDSLASE